MELGKRGYLENGEDIIFVTGPPGAGKSTIIRHFQNYASNNLLGDNFNALQTVINDKDYVDASVAQAQQEGTGGVRWNEDRTFIIDDPKILERAYDNFFFNIANQEYTGYPIVVEWAGGVRKEGIEGADHSYETLGKIFTKYEEQIMPRVRAVLNLVTDPETREERRIRRKGKEARRPTVGNLLYANDFRTIAGRFPEGRVFDIDNQWGFLENEVSHGYPETTGFLYALYFPFSSLALEKKLGRPRTEIHAVDGITRDDQFFNNNNYEALQKDYERLREFQGLLKTKRWSINEIRDRMQSPSQKEGGITKS